MTNSNFFQKFKTKKKSFWIVPNGYFAKYKHFLIQYFANIINHYNKTSSMSLHVKTVHIIWSKVEE